MHGYASGANSNQECSLCWRPCCLGPNFEFGVRGHVSNKAPSVFFAPTGHPFQGLLLLESTLRFRIYAAAQHGGTHHGDSDPWCVASKVASLAQSSRCFSHSLEQSSIGFFFAPTGHPIQGRFLLESASLSSPVVPCRPRLSSPVFLRRPLSSSYFQI